MQKVMGIIDDTKDDFFLNDLTFHRSLASVPFGSRYRLIDFILSNMVNSGIRNIGILLNNKLRSLMDHLGPGKEWDLDRKKDGLFMLLPHHNTNNIPKLEQGNIPVFQNNLDYLEKSKQEYVIIAGTSIIANFNFQDALNYHQDSRADITVLYHENHKLDSSNCTFIRTDNHNRVIDIKVEPKRKRYSKISMDIFILKRTLLMDLIDSCISRGQLDLLKDGIIPNLSQLRVYAYRHSGYVSIINSVQNYFKANMDLLDSKIWQELFQKNGVIYTKVKDEPPTKYFDSAVVENVLLANGCSLKGQVQNSILFRGVSIGKGAKVKNSIIMQKCSIEDGAVVENAILDKNVVVGSGKRLIGDPNYPLIVQKKAVI